MNQDAVRRYKIGVTEDPWLKTQNREKTSQPGMNGVLSSGHTNRKLSMD
ncbi:hypothetical protein [Pseudomonas sp. R151218B TE3479]